MTEQAAVAERGEISSQRFIANVMSNLAVVILNMVVGIWFTPYLIGILGVALFGVATLALSVSNYITIFDTALNNAAGRFLTIQLRQKDFDKANRTFNSALGLAIVLVLALLPFVVIVAWFSPQLFNVPAGNEHAARWVFGLALVSYELFLIRSVFNTAPFARNRLDLQNGILASSVLVRVLVTVLLLSLAAAPGLSHVGVGLLAGTVVSLVLAALVFRKLTPQLHINLGLFDRAQLGLLFGMSGWVFVNQMGSILFLNIDQIIVNTALGPAIQGLYASALQWSILLRTLARTVSTALAPVMVIQFAAGDNRRLVETSVLSVKLLGLLMALPIGLIAGLSQPLLRVWLGPDFENISTLLVVLILPLSINLAVLPLFSLQVAYNRVKIPGIVSILAGLLNLVLAVWWVRWGSLGLGVAAASALVLTLKNAIFTPLYGARIQQLPWHTYFPGLLVAAMGTVFAAAAGYWLSKVWAIESWFELAAVGLAVGIPYALLAGGLGLSSGDRRVLRRIAGRFTP